MMSYSIDNDKQLVQKGMLEIYCTMSDYELDRENKVLFPTYLVNMKNWKGIISALMMMMIWT